MAEKINGSSTTTTFYPIIAALKKADDQLGKDREWKPKSPLQERFLAIYNRTAREALGLKEIKAISHEKVEVINKWLAENGFPDLQLDQIDAPPGYTTFAAAAILDLLVEWVEEGTESKVNYEGQDYPAFRLKNGVGFHRSDENREPIIELATKSGHRVFLTIPDENPGQGFDLLAKAERLMVTMSWDSGKYEGVVVPKVKLLDKPDISWLAGMTTECDNGDPAWLVQAIQETRFRMNEIGARVESAAAVSGLRFAAFDTKEPYVIDRPFMIWFVQEGLHIPIMVGYIMPTEWSDPGDIGGSF